MILGERPGAASKAAALLALALLPTRALPAPGHVHAEGALARAVLRALRPLPGWRWPPGPAEGAAVRIGLRRPGDAWGEDFEPLALARLRDGSPPRWVRVRRKGPEAATEPAPIRDFDASEVGAARAADAVHAVAYRLADAAVVPEPVAVRRCRAAPGLCDGLALEPAGDLVWGVFVRRDAADSPGSEARRRLADLSADPFGDRLLRRLGADWFVEGGAPARGSVPDERGLMP